MPKMPCSVDGCGNMARSYGKCRKHVQGKCIEEGCLNRAVIGCKCIKHANGECIEEGCLNSARIGGKCNRHANGKCIEEGCENIVFSRGKCRKHAKGKCIEEGCENIVFSRGKCRKHANWTCSVDGCDKVVYSRGKCKRHTNGECIEEGCLNRAVIGSKCILHANGACIEEGCENIVLSRGKCRKHANGTCSVDGCENSARKLGRCLKHAYGNCIAFNDTGLQCTKNPVYGDSGYKWCIAHGGGYMCIICKSVRLPRKEGVCWECDNTSVRTRKKRKERIEKKIRSALHSSGFRSSYVDMPLPCQPNKRRVDMSFLYYASHLGNFETHAVLLEVDEHQHRGYSIDCEISRMSEIKDQYKCPIHFIRFNPHSLDKDEICFENLIQTLKHAAENNLAQNEPDGIKVTYIGYTMDREHKIYERWQKRHSEIDNFSTPQKSRKRPAATPLKSRVSKRKL